MRDEFKDLFAESMDTLRLSGETKERLTAALLSQILSQQSTQIPSKQSTQIPSQQSTPRQGKEPLPMKRKSIRKTALTVLAAAVLIGTLSAGAVYLAGRKGGLEGELHMSDEQRMDAQNSGLVNRPDAAPAPDDITSATDNGITITAAQTIADNHYAQIALRVDGYHVPDGRDPDVGQIAIRVTDPTTTPMTNPTTDPVTDPATNPTTDPVTDPVTDPGENQEVDDDDDWISWSGGFYNGIVSENGHAAYYDDGSPLEYTPDGGLVLRYAAQDGSLEYHIALSDGSGNLIGKRIEIYINGIGTGDKATYFPDQDGEWYLTWVLHGSDETRTVYPQQSLGDTGVVLTQATVSPISLRTGLLLPPDFQQALTNAVDDDDGIPRLLGVRLRDGTLLPYLYLGPGYAGLRDDDVYEQSFAIDRVLNPNDVDALLFLKSYPTGNNPLTEDNLYIVPIG